MRSPFQIGEIRIHAALPADRVRGLKCFASCTVGAWTFDSLQVRRTADGRYVVQWPTHVDANGVEHAYYQPADRLIRGAIYEAVNAAVLAAARRGAWIE